MIIYMSEKKIDIKKAIQSKYKGYLPGFLYRWIQRLIHEDELNQMMELQHEVGGVAMGQKIIDYLGITCEIIGAERLPKPEERTLFVSNHPLGGADGVIYAALLGAHYEGQLRIMVNDVLMNVYQFQDIFLPINKYGQQARQSIQLINQALESHLQLLTFPAGLCSRMNKEGQVRDTEWLPSFVRMAVQHQRQIVPLYFEGQNSPRFYRWAKLRARSGWKFNAELILLPSELIRAKGKHYRIYVGDPIPYPTLPSPKEAPAFAQHLRDSLYSYPQKYSQL